MPGSPSYLDDSRASDTVLAKDPGGVVCVFFHVCRLSFPSPSPWAETARYRLKYCLKQPFNLIRSVTRQHSSPELVLAHHEPKVLKI